MPGRALWSEVRGWNCWRSIRLFNNSHSMIQKYSWVFPSAPRSGGIFLRLCFHCTEYFVSKKQNHDTNEEYIGKGKSAIGYAFRSRDFRRGKKIRLKVASGDSRRIQISCSARLPEGLCWSLWVTQVFLKTAIDCCTEVCAEWVCGSVGDSGVVFKFNCDAGDGVYGSVYQETNGQTGLQVNE